MLAEEVGQYKVSIFINLYPCCCIREFALQDFGGAMCVGH